MDCHRRAELSSLAERLRAGGTEAHVHRMTRGSSILGGCECGALYDETGWHEPVERCVSCDKPLPVACPDCIDYALDATRVPREADTLRAQLAELVEAERSVTWYDWSDNDEDAVESIDRLRSALARAEAVLEKGKR